MKRCANPYCLQAVPIRVCSELCQSCRWSRRKGIAFGFVWGAGFGIVVMMFGGW